MLRVLIEVDGARGREGGGRCNPRVDRAGLRRPLLLHGSGENTWALVRAAARHRMSTRIGLEDTDRLPDGGIAADNAALVAAAVGIMRG